MSATLKFRRTVAELDFGGAGSARYNIGNRSIHQFWHLFSASFRGVLLAPQRRADSGNIAWTWRELAENEPLTPRELAGVRQRLTDASAALNRTGKAGSLLDDGPGSGGLDAQVRAKVGELVAELAAYGDPLLAGFVCRTESGPMVHSWGADTPAQPHHPGSAENVISGIVLLGTEPAAGLSVVLENRSGGVVARTKSGEAGAFIFPNVAPGAYRVRVTGRPEFGAGGLAVTLERESITGLELRGRAAEGDGTAPGAPENLSPDAAAQSHPARKATLALAVILLLFGGAYLGWNARKPSAVSREPAKPSGWQSAQGQLAGPAAAAPADDRRPVGSDGQWSVLKPAPALPNSRSDRVRPAGDGSPPRGATARPSRGILAEPSATPPPDGSVAGLADLSAPQEKSDKSGQTEKQSLGPPTAGPKVRDESGAKEASAAAGDLPPEKESGATDGTDDATPRPTDKNPAETSAKAKPKAPRNSSAQPAATDPDPADGAAPSNGAPSAAPTAASSAGTSAGPDHSSRSGKSSRSSLSPSSSPSNSSTSSGSPDSASSSTAAESGAAPNGPAKPGSARQPAKGPADHAAAVAAAATEPASSGPAPGTPDAAKPEVPAKSNSAPSPTPAGNKAAPAPANPTPSSAAAPEDLPEENPAASPAPPAPAKASPNPARPAAIPPAAGSPATVPAPSAAPEESPAEPADSPASPGNPAQPSGKKRAKKKPAPAPAETATAQTPESPPAPGPGASVARTPGPAFDSSLDRLGQVSHSAWKPRLLRDQILPTQPVPVAADDAVEALRRRLRQEQTDRIPRTFRQPSVTSGFAVDFLPEPLQGPPRWCDAAGAEPIGAIVRGNRAEFSWPGAVPGRPVDAVLSYPDGRILARVQADDAGSPILSVAPAVHGWFWFGIGPPASTGPEALSPPNAERLSWRLVPDAAVPDSWPQTDHWTGGRGNRIDLPLGAGSAGNRTYALALVDPLTGWALVSAITVR